MSLVLAAAGDRRELGEVEPELAEHVGGEEGDRELGAEEERVGVERDAPATRCDHRAEAEARRARPGREQRALARLIGSNFPMIFPKEALDQVDALGLDDETRALFLGGNATRVFGLGD